MKNNTLDDYKKAIRAKYNEIINHNPDGYLQNPTPGNLRDKCLLLLDDINADDRKNYKYFFELKSDIDVRKQIENFDINKFRPLQSFLLGRNENPSEKKLEILAILVELQPRPFVKFREIKKIEFKSNPISTDEEKTDAAIQTAPVNTQELKEGKEKVEAEKVVEEVSPEEENKNEEEEVKPDNSDSTPMVATHNFYSDSPQPKVYTTKSYKLTANHIKIAAAIFVVFAVGLLVKKLSTEHECMTWKTDHYENVPCNTEVQSFTSNAIIHLDRETLKYQKRITVCDTTTFFLNKKPCVWYCKMPNGTIEYFSYPGLHPVTGETLKKITQHIVDKYVKINNEKKL